MASYQLALGAGTLFHNMKKVSSSHGRGQRATKSTDSDLNAAFVRWAASVPAAPKIVTLGNGVKLQNDLVLYVLMLAVKQKASFNDALEFILRSDEISSGIVELSNTEEPIDGLFGSALKSQAQNL